MLLYDYTKEILNVSENCLFIPFPLRFWYRILRMEGLRQQAAAKNSQRFSARQFLSPVNSARIIPPALAVIFMNFLIASLFTSPWVAIFRIGSVSLFLFSTKALAKQNFLCYNIVVIMRRL